MHPYLPPQLPSLRRLSMLAGAAIACAAPQVAVADDLRYDAFATVSPFAGFLIGSVDYGVEAGGIVELGAGGSVSQRFGRFFDLGLGLRYDHGSEDTDFVHLVAAPMTATLVISLGTTSELHAGIGLGPAYGRTGGSGRKVHVLGASLELALAFAQRIRSDGLGLYLQLGIRGDVLPELTAEPDDDLNGSDLLHAQFPFVRAGVSWR